jgi:hypothetical protein
LREGKVAEYAREMSAGKWYLSNDAIVSINGKTANGQHRLKAVVKSGVACEFILLTTENESLIKIIDGGTPRRISDVLKMEGILYAKLSPSVAQWVEGYKRKALTAAGNMMATQSSNPGSVKLFSRQERIQWSIRNAAKITRSGTLINALYKKSGVIGETLSNALYYLIAEKYSDEMAASFISELYTGETQSTALRNLRNILIRDLGSKKKIPISSKFGYLIQGFNSWKMKTNRDVYRISVNDKYPEIA